MMASTLLVLSTLAAAPAPAEEAAVPRDTSSRCMPARG